MLFVSAVAQITLTPLLVSVALPCAVFGLECCLAKSAPQERASSQPRAGAVVVIPAHDEAAGIGPVVRALRTQLRDDDQLLVIADNCSDDTASIAEGEGAEVLVRIDPKRRGKGYAISFALEHLAKAPPETVVIIDADCELAPGALDILVSESQRSDRPVQADYVLEAPSEGSGPLARISAFAVLVRNRVRPLGLYRLGLPCQMTGSGMAFPWQQLASLPTMGSNIVEDLALGLNLALAGYAPQFCPQARITSWLPETQQGEQSQRRRWETGQLTTLRSYAPRLLAAAWGQRRLDLAVLALDLSVPPLALLVLLQVPALAVGLGAGLIFGTWLPLGVAVTGASFLGLGVATAFHRFGRGTTSLADLARVPFYVARKLGLYGSFFRHGQERQWVRTERTRHR